MDIQNVKKEVSKKNKEIQLLLTKIKDHRSKKKQNSEERSEERSSLDETPTSFAKHKQTVNVPEEVPGKVVLSQDIIRELSVIKSHLSIMHHTEDLQENLVLIKKQITKMKSSSAPQLAEARNQVSKLQKKLSQEKSTKEMIQQDVFALRSQVQQLERASKLKDVEIEKTKLQAQNRVGGNQVIDKQKEQILSLETKLGETHKYSMLAQQENTDLKQTISRYLCQRQERISQQAGSLVEIASLKSQVQRINSDLREVIAERGKDTDLLSNRYKYEISTLQQNALMVQEQKEVIGKELEASKLELQVLTGMTKILDQEKSQLLHTIQWKSQQVQSLNNTIEQLEQEAKLKNKLQNQVGILRAENESMSQMMCAFWSQAHQMFGMYQENMHSLLSNIIQKIDLGRSQADQLSNSVGKLQTMCCKMEEKSRRCESLQQVTQELREQLRLNISKVDEDKRTIDQMNKEFESVYEKYQSQTPLIQEYKKIIQQNSELISRNANQLAQMNEFQEEMEQTKDRLLENEQLFTDLQNKLDSSVQQYKAELSRLQEEGKKRQETGRKILEESKKQTLGLRQSVAQYEEEKGLMVKEVEDLRKKDQVMRRQVANYVMETKAKDKMVKAQKEAVKILTQQKEQIQMGLAEKDGEVTALRSQLEQRKQVFEDLHLTTMESNRLTILRSAQLESQLEVQKTRNMNLSRDLQSLKSKLEIKESLGQELSSTENKMLELNTKVRELESQLELSTQTILGLNNNTEDLHKTLQTVKSQLQQSVQLNSTLRTLHQQSIQQQSRKTLQLEDAYRVTTTQLALSESQVVTLTASLSQVKSTLQLVTISNGNLKQFGEQVPILQQQLLDAKLITTEVREELHNKQKEFLELASKFNDLKAQNSPVKTPKKTKQAFSQTQFIQRHPQQTDNTSAKIQAQLQLNKVLIEKQSGQIEELESTVRVLEDSIQSHSKKYMTIIEELNEEIAELTDDNNRLVSELQNSSMISN